MAWTVSTYPAPSFLASWPICRVSRHYRFGHCFQGRFSFRLSPRQGYKNLQIKSQKIATCFHTTKHVLNSQHVPFTISKNNIHNRSWDFLIFFQTNWESGHMFVKARGNPRSWKRDFLQTFSDGSAVTVTYNFLDPRILEQENSKKIQRHF